MGDQSEQVSVESPTLERGLYGLRFSDDELRQARAFWVPICRFLEQYIATDGATLDVGAGYCHFINTVRSTRKFALDVNAENLDRWANADVRRFVGSGHRLEMFDKESLDTVFASNVFEHFHTKDEVAAGLREVERVLRPGGRFVIIQPNFAYAPRQYFDYFDHRLAFTHRGMVEGLEMSGFAMIRTVGRFLPFTSKGALPKASWLVALYLRLPWIWRFMGSQMLLVAEKPIVIPGPLR